VLDKADIDYLTERRDILEQMEAIKGERDDRIRQLLALDCAVGELVKATGLTRARIYQIGKGTR
jgi:hypothetical protein